MQCKEKIQSKQWHYVPTDQNPADIVTISVPAAHLQLTGPTFLTQVDGISSTLINDFDLVYLERDFEVRPQVSVLLANVRPGNVCGSHRFHHFSRWTALLRATVHLRHIAISFCQNAL